MSVTASDHSVGVTVTGRVATEHMLQFEIILRQVLQTALDHPGHVSGEVLRGAAAPGGRDYHIIYRFADSDSLVAWENSNARRNLVAQLAPLMMESTRRPLTGLEAWFDLPQSLAPPPRSRMAIITWIGIWPLVSLALWQIAPHLGALPFLARTGVTSALTVVAMTYVVMPRLARFAEPWLRAP